MLPSQTFAISVLKSPLTFNANQGNDTINRFSQERVNGAAQDIEFELESASVGVNGSFATVSFQRQETSHVVHIYRRSQVIIDVNDVVIFRGFVNGQRTDKEKTFLSCIGVENILDQIPIVGSTRLAPFRRSNKFSKETLNIFNESNQLDMIKVNNNAFDLVLDNGITSGSFPEQWTKLQLVLYIFDKVLRENSGRNYGNFITLNRIDMGNTTAAIRRAIITGDNEPNKIPSDLTVMDGVFSLLSEGLREAELIGYFEVNQDDLKLSLRVRKLFDATNKKTVVADDKSTQGGDKGKVHYDYQMNYDFNSPTQTVVVSGKRFVSTTLVIDPNNTFYRTITAVSSLEYGKVEYEFVSTANGDDQVFDSQNPAAKVGYKQKDLLKSGKLGFISDIRNRILELDSSTLEPVFVDDREILIQFKVGSEFGGQEGKLILMDGELWQTLKGKNNLATTPIIGDRILGKLDRLQWRFANDKLKLTITGFKPDEFGTLFDNVQFIYIPVTIEIDNRIIGISSRKERQLEIQTDEVLYQDNNDAKTFDPEARGIEIIERDDVRPVSFVQNILSLDSGVTFQDGDFDSLSELIIKGIAKKILFDNQRNDGTALRIMVPWELWETLKDDRGYPVTIGDWIDKIDGVNGVGDVRFDRNLTLTEISYNRTTVTLTLT